MKTDPTAAAERPPQTWQELIQRLIRDEHAGTVVAMTRHLNRYRKISNSTVENWEDGIGGDIPIPHIRLVVEAYGPVIYGLDGDALIELVYGWNPAGKKARCRHRQSRRS